MGAAFTGFSDEAEAETPQEHLPGGRRVTIAGTRLLRSSHWILEEGWRRKE